MINLQRLETLDDLMWLLSLMARCARGIMSRWRLWFPPQMSSAKSSPSSSYIASSSSFYWASVANAPKVLQPYWLIVLHFDVPDLTASFLLWGPSGQRWRCLWTFLFSNDPTFATSRLQEILAAKCRTTWARNGRWILPANFPTSTWNSGIFYMP